MVVTCSCKRGFCGEMYMGYEWNANILCVLIVTVLCAPGEDSTSWGFFVAAVYKRMKAREGQRSGLKKCFMTFFSRGLGGICNCSYWRKLQLEIIATVVATQGRSVYFGHGSTCIPSFILIGIHNHSQYFSTISNSFTKKSSTAFSKKSLRSRCDWPNFINDCFKTYWDWGCHCKHSTFFP